MSILKIKEKINWKSTAPTIFLVFNSFVWYIFISMAFTAFIDGQNILQTEKMMIFISYFSTVAFTALLGGKVFPQIRNQSLYIWFFMGVIASSLFAIISNSNDFLLSILSSIFLGASVGVGFPSCLSYFADSTSIEKRGFVSLAASAS